MNKEKFCLRWNDFEKNINSAFKELKDDKDFFDVTIVCADEQIQAHKVILSACSPFFKNILRRNPHNHPLLYMHGVTYLDLVAVLDFMYHGEVNIAQEELNSFLAVAESLRIKGLTQSESQASQEISNLQSKTKSLVSKFEPVKSKNSNNISEDEIQEIANVKTEPATTLQSEVYNTERGLSNHNAVSTLDTTYIEENYESYRENSVTDAQADVSYNSVYGEASSGQSFQDPSELLQFVELDKSDVARRRYFCSLCHNFFHQNKSNVRNHVECKHFPDAFMYTCETCGANLPSKAALQKHKHKLHRYV